MLDKVKVNLEEIINWRRRLHQIPESAYNEYQTTEYLLEEVNKIGNFIIHRPCKTGFVAELKGVGERVIALRSDIDALPITELVEGAYKSKHPGYMHACGHDGHMAMLLAAMKYLYSIREKLNGSIKFIFQHAEEVAPGGAIEILDSQVLDDVEMIFGVHLMPLEASKNVLVKENYATTAMDAFDIKVIGVGGHGSTPELAIDPIMISSEIISNINNIVSRNTGLLDQAVISVCSINSPESYNVIPNEVNIKGNIRTVSSALSKKLKARVEKVAVNVAKAHDAEAKVQWLGHVAAVNNDKKAVEIIREAGLLTVDKTMVKEQAFITSSEDFSSYQSKIPGALWRLGVGGKHDLHSPYFSFDEEALEIGALVHIKSALLALNFK